VAAGFSLAALSGLLMFVSQANELISNRAFVSKMGLLTLAACNAAWFHGRGSLVKLDGVARFQVVLSTLIWLAVITCGRWIAYI
jgi:apolipoprotein N-acyltransferase